MLPAAAGPDIDPTSPLLFIINSASGRNDLAAKRHTIEAALSAAGRTGELIDVLPEDVDRIARDAAAKALACRTAVVAVGGDGTINAVAQAAYAQGCPMGVVAQGTFNYFARTHGISEDAGEAVSALLAATPVPVQVGLINDRVFLVNASLGLYPKLLEDREAFKARFGRSRLVALGSTLVTVLGGYRQLKLRIERGRTARDVTTPTLFVGNNRLQLEQVGVQEARTLDQGCLAAVMLRPIGALSMLGLICRGAIGTLGDASTVESFEFESMVVKPRLGLRGSRVKVAMDGEVSWLRAPIEFRASPNPLYLLKARGEERTGDPGQDRA